MSLKVKGVFFPTLLLVNLALLVFAYVSQYPNNQIHQGVALPLSNCSKLLCNATC